MTAAHILSSTATIHAARAYVPPRKTTVADLIQSHNERRATVGLMLSALIAGDESMRLPRYEAGAFTDRYRHELQFIGLAFDDDVAGEWLYRNIQAEESRKETQ